MNFHEITNDQQWSEAIELRNLFNWSNPISVAEAKSFFERSKDTRNDDRHAAFDDNGTMIIHGGVTQNRNADDNSYWFGVYLDPHHQDAPERFRIGIHECLRRTKDYGGSRAMIESRGEYPWCSQVLLEEGFALDMKAPYSRLDLTATDFHLQENVVSLAEFFAANPDDGLHRFWRLEMDVAGDLPLPFPFIETPFETFKSYILDPEVDLNCKFVLEEDGELKGLSQLWPSKVNRTLAANGLTGTRRQYRRQGVATRLKQHSAAWAKQQGIEQIFTDNEENNPMYQLNLQLGFRRMFDYEVYSKSC